MKEPLLYLWPKFHCNRSLTFQRRPEKLKPNLCKLEHTYTHRWIRYNNIPLCFSSQGDLRVRAVFRKAVQVCHVYCNLKIGFTCRITVIFGTLKDGSLLINTLASIICFSYRNMFQNGLDALSKKLTPFCQEAQNFI